MSDPVRFLNALGHALAVMTLYSSGHPSRERAIDDAFQELDGLATSFANPSFTFIEDEVIFGREPLRDLKAWEWGRRLVAVGIQRIEVERRITRDEFEGFLQEVSMRLTPSSAVTAENRQMRSLGIRFGTVGLNERTGLAAALSADAGLTGTGPSDLAGPPEASVSTTLDLALGEEADTFRWLQGQVQHDRAIPLIEAEAVVRSLAVAMRSGRHVVLPLLQLKEFDQYTTTHALNVAVLSMGLAEAMACSSKDVRALGVAGLLHDIGKVRIPHEVLTKPGRLSQEEIDIMRRHPVDGARILMQSHEDLELAAVVAYEHHIMLDGGGYPQVHYHRDCTMAARMVHVCDVFDALRTNRPYREAWPAERTLSYLDERAGTEFDPAIVKTFAQMMRAGDSEIRVLHDDRRSLAS